MNEKNWISCGGSNSIIIDSIYSSPAFASRRWTLSVVGLVFFLPGPRVLLSPQWELCKYIDSKKIRVLLHLHSAPYDLHWCGIFFCRLYFLFYGKSMYIIWYSPMRTIHYINNMFTGSLLHGENRSDEEKCGVDYKEKSARIELVLVVECIKQSNFGLFYSILTVFDIQAPRSVCHMPNIPWSEFRAKSVFTFNINVINKYYRWKFHFPN